MKTIALKIKWNKGNQFSDKNIITKINPCSADIDSFKNSILISLHYCDIPFHPERISKLKLGENKYNFIRIIHITPNVFQINNPNISLTKFDENNKKYYAPKNNSTNKPQIVKLKNDRYAAIKSLKNKFMKLDKLLASFSHVNFKQHMLQNILKT